MLLRVLVDEEVAGQRVRLCRSDDVALALFEGMSPTPMRPHRGVAPVHVHGMLGDEVAYTEEIPDGVRLSVEPPPSEDLLPYIVVELLEALRAMHDAGLVHGAVGPHNIVIGPAGEVVLIGRGRREGTTASMDLVAARSLLPSDDEETLTSADVDVDALRAQVGPDDAVRLGGWVIAQETTEDAVEALELDVTDMADEIVPDLGDDSDVRGLLDWEPTDFGREDPHDITNVDSPFERMANELWGRLAAPPPEPPADRFTAVAGIPSQAVRDLIRNSAVDFLPAPAGGDLGTWLLPSDEPPTQIREAKALFQPPQQQTHIEPVPLEVTAEVAAHGPVQQFRLDLVAAVVAGMALMWLVMQLL